MTHARHPPTRNPPIELSTASIIIHANYSVRRMRAAANKGTWLLATNLFLMNL